MIKWNYLMRLAGKIVSGAALLSVLIIASCGDDGDEPQTPVVVEFANAEVLIGEGDLPQTITLSLDKAAFKNGTLELTASPAGASDWATFPSTISITEGNTVVQFNITPIQNSILDGTREITFTIANPSSGFTLGEQTTMDVNITDDESPAEVNFSTDASNTLEDDDAGVDVVVDISVPSPGAGNLTITFESANAEYTTNFTTIPAATGNTITLPVDVEDNSVSFKVIPVDDEDVNAAREIDFTISSFSTAAITVGEIINTHTFTINDNETPSTAVFAGATSSISESVNEGVTVPITLDPETLGTGTVNITFTSPTAIYGTHFTTDPAASEGSLTVPVGTGVTAASFKVIPIDDSEITANRVITFTLGTSTGVVVVGSSNTTHEVTIQEDDAITTIADVRAMYSGTANITSPLNIQGIVTSINPQVNTNNIWVQDATGGIVVRFSSANNNTIARGDEVKVMLNGGQFFEFSGLLQVQNVPNANASVISENNTLPAPEVVTVTEFLTGAYEGKLVRINDVAFVDADGVATMSGTKVISNGTTTTNVRTETTAGHPFKDSAMPLGFGTITGLAGENGGAVQIIPMVFADDVFASSATGSLNVTQSLVDFGSVDNGAESTSQSYTVQGTGLAANIVITASANYKVSTDDNTFTSSVTIDAANANSSNTIYVKFIPTTGVNQAVEGTITHKPLGAVSQSFAVTGTESGNAAIPQLLVENFDYGVSDNSDITAATSNWTRHSGAQGPQYVSTGLTYTDYSGSNVGGAISSTRGGSGVNDGDVHRTFTLVNSTSDIYISFLVNVSSAQSTADYFFHLGPNTIGTTFRSRVFARSNGAGWSFGLSKNTETRADDNTVLNFNQTYLVVLKYSYSTATTSDDQVSLYVYETGVPATEPGTPTITIGPTGSTGTSDPVDIGSVAVRQGSNTPNAIIDGIRVALTWNDLFN